MNLILAGIIFTLGCMEKHEENVFSSETEGLRTQLEAQGEAADKLPNQTFAQIYKTNTEAGQWMEGVLAFLPQFAQYASEGECYFRYSNNPEKLKICQTQWVPKYIRNLKENFTPEKCQITVHEYKTCLVPLMNLEIQIAKRKREDADINSIQPLWEAQDRYMSEPPCNAVGVKLPRTCFKGSELSLDDFIEFTGML